MGTISLICKPKKVKPIGVITLVEEIGPSNSQVKSGVDSDTVGIFDLIVAFDRNERKNSAIDDY